MGLMPIFAGVGLETLQTNEDNEGRDAQRQIILPEESREQTEVPKSRHVRADTTAAATVIPKPSSMKRAHPVGHYALSQVKVIRR